MSRHHAQLLRTKNGALDTALFHYGDTTDAEVCPLQEESIGIGEVRNIIGQASLRPTTGSYRLVIVLARVITTEAQQALLKILEEPPESTRFLFVLPPEATLLKTLLSRFEDITPDNVGTVVISEDFTSFLYLSYAERLDTITKQLAKKESGFIAAMRQGLATYLSTTGFSSSEQRSLAFLIIERLGTRGASNKMLLEALALLLPIGQKNKEMIH